MQPKVRLLRRETLLATIEGSVGSHMFRHLWAEVDGQKKDLLRDGQVSCAYYVSTILSMPNFKLLPMPRATVTGLMEGLTAAGWRKVEEPTLPGEVIVWEKAAQAGGEEHLHSGFYLGGEEAISHIDKVGVPQRHHLAFGAFEGKSQRPIAAVYTHAALEA